jgi:hypothetical protein
MRLRSMIFAGAAIELLSSSLWDEASGPTQGNRDLDAHQLV